MCNIKEIFRDKNKLVQDTDELFQASGAIIIAVEKRVKEIEIKAKDNIQKLSLLL